jgi:hypothetical protein
VSIVDIIKSWFGASADAEPEGPQHPLRAPPQLSIAGANGAPLAVIDFAAVLSAAGIAADVRERVSKAKGLLRTLPADAPSATKRQIVEAAFQAFEIPTQKIVQGASAEVEALQRYIKAGEDDKATRLVAGELRIAELEGEIGAVRTSMAAAVAAQERRAKHTSEEIATVQPIVQFFAHEATLPAIPTEGSASGRPPPVLGDDDEVSLLEPPSAPPGPRSPPPR